jgi:hypothetical protein
LLKAENLTVICEPIVQKMWEPRRLTTLWAFTACYRDSFTFFFLLQRHSYTDSYTRVSVSMTSVLASNGSCMGLLDFDQDLARRISYRSTKKSTLIYIFLVPHRDKQVEGLV